MKDEWESRKPAFFRATLHEEGLKKAKVLEAEKKANKAKKAIDRYNHDPEYRFLFDCICDVFANLLKTDMKLLKECDYEDISLAAKWCPCESIARKVFPREEYVEYGAVEEAHYAYRVRTRLRKEVLDPLRKALELPEVYMCAKRWRDIPYDRVASTAMNLENKVFLKRDRDGFEEYLTDVKEGDMTISAGSLLPHEIVRRRSLMRSQSFNGRGWWMT
uniref:DUF2828 domain-containing protein n=1 Tax=Chenopodium quinoa TaxID=63459 RepID=A0A803KSV9_CHEQI